MTDTTTPIPSRPEPPHIARATLVLARVLAGAPDLEASLAAGSALAILSDVHPPYPPHPAHLVPLPVDDGIPAAYGALMDAAAELTDVQDLSRLFLAARELRPFVPSTPDVGATP